jgi:two-component system cell cycle response regulator
VTDRRRLGNSAGVMPTNILLIEDSPSDAQLIRLLLRGDPHYAVTTTARIDRGIAYLSRERFGLILLDLTLPDGEGIAALRRVHHAARSIPIVVLDEHHDEALAIEALRGGAQDYLPKGQIDRSLLLRVLRYACERHSLMAALHSLALTDTLTGLCNRRGFVTIADERLKLARRMGQSVAIVFVDLNGMKRINDELGHEFGDQALIATAHILKATFRASDVIARLGGDEFVVLAMAAQTSATARIRKRLMQSLTRYNESGSRVQVSFSVGFAHYNPLLAGETSIEQLMTQADEAMYVEKREHHTSRRFQERKRAKG